MSDYFSYSTILFVNNVRIVLVHVMPVELRPCLNSIGRVDEAVSSIYTCNDLNDLFEIKWNIIELLFNDFDGININIGDIFSLLKYLWSPL